MATTTILPRVNFYDGQNLTEEDLDVEQTAWHDTVAQTTNFLAGSGVEKDTSTQIVLFDSYDVPTSVSTLISGNNFDGEPIYEEDSFGNTIYEQPSDSVNGVQLEVEISDASLAGSGKTKVYIFGKKYGGDFVQEVLTFEDNGSLTTQYYFTEIVALMFQDFRGNGNTVVDGVGCRNVGGRCRILEALPMTVVLDTIMAEQSEMPNMNYRSFKPANNSKTLDNLLDEIEDSGTGLDKDDLNINTTATTTRKLAANSSVGVLIGEKFKATTNNIQKITLLLAVEENELAVSGHEFDFSGDIVVGVRKLQTTTNCPTDIIPDTAIEYDPEPTALAEVSFNMSELEDRGVVLTDEPQEVDFVFTQSLLANPNVDPTLEIGKYYVITIGRTGNISTGDIVLQEAANTTSTDETDEMRMTVFTNNEWTDVSERDLWFKIYTDAVRITSGNAIDNGVLIVSPKTKKNTSTNVEESYIEGNHSLVDISSESENYIIVQKKNSYSDAATHPSTGNLVFTRISDEADVSVVSEDSLTTLINAGNKTIVLAHVVDENSRNNPEISGVTNYPGLVTANTLTILAPTSDITTNNLIGSILIPNTTEPELKYRIIDVQTYTDSYGDVNGDGTIDLTDVLRCQELDGYATDLVSGTVSSVDQTAAIVNGTVDMMEIIRADVNGDALINVSDSQRLQQYLSLGTAFSVGASFKRTVITVENLTDPLTTTANILGSDSSFNTVPFSPVNYRIDFIPTWTEQNISITDMRRFVTKTFTDIEEDDITGTTKSGGTNSTFISGDIILGGEILDPDGETFSMDLEVNSIVLNLPEGSTQAELDVFNNYIKGKMKFYDSTYVGASALTNNQVKVIPSIQSFAKNSDGYDFESDDGYSAVQTTVAVLYTQSSGILRIRANNIKNIATRPELTTKIVLQVYLKKAGFANIEVTVSADDLGDLLTDL